MTTMTRGGSDMRAIVRNCMLAFIVMALMMPAASAGEGTTPSPSWEPLIEEVTGTVPQQARATDGRFIENQGQWDDHVGFVTDTGFGHAVFGTDGVTYDLTADKGGHRVRVVFSAKGPVAPEGVSDMGFDTNYFIGNDPDLWVRGARSYQEVIYRDVWPGTHVRYYHLDGNLKYDLILDAEADPSLVRFRVVGAEGLRTEGGVLDIRLSKGLALHDRDLVAWYTDGEEVDVSFVQQGDCYGFSLDKEEGRAMVIDPVVVHSSTLIGGTYADTVVDVELDGEGNIYTLAYTGSDDYPITTGAYDDELAQSDAAVTKFNHNCSSVLWSTFVGGSSWDSVSGLELDRDYNVYFTGSTWSHDWPYTKGAFNPQFNLGMNNYQMDPYVTKLNSQGNELVYSTYVGGSSTEWVGDIKVNDGQATVVGQTQSYDFPTESGSYGGVHGDGFLFTMNENGSHIVDTFFWGGFGSELANCLVFAPNGDIVVGGRTTSMDMFTTPGAFQPTRPCFSSGFICRFTPSTDKMVFSTYFGGAYSTSISDLALDDDGNVYVAGGAYQGGPGVGFITTPGAHQEEFYDMWEGFLAKMDANATRLEYCTLLGGNGDDYLYDLELDPNDNMVVVGSMGDGDNFTVTPDGLDDEWAGESEGFLFVLNDDGSAPVYSTFYGGQMADGVYAVEIDDVDNYVVAGATESMDIPITPDGFQTKPSGGSEGFVSIVGELSPTSAPLDLNATGGEGFIQLDWEFPEDDGGYPVKRFLLFRGTAEDDLRFYKDAGTRNVHVDDSVDWGVRYYYAVYSSNGKGISPPSNVAFAVSVTVPDPPINMTAIVEFSSVVIDWEVPAFTGGLPITGYIIYRIAEGDHMELVTPIPGDVLSYEDNTVEDGINYTYTLTVLNGYGESREPVSVTVRTFDVPTPPMGPSHTYGDLYINLSWDPPLDDFGLPVEGYNVYRRAGGGPSEMIGVVGAMDLTFVDTQVTVGTLYVYYITAMNGKGESGPSEGLEAMVMVPPDPPTGVEAVASEYFVKVTWTAPAFDGASPISGYRVYLWETPEEPVCLGGPNMMGMAEPLLQFLHDVAYDGVVRTYFVTAINAEGESEPSGNANTVLYQVPDAPEALTVAWSDGRLDIGWSPPSTDGGTPLLGYTLYRRAQGEEDFTVLASLAVDEMAFVDLDTRNGEEYTYTLTAHNLAGVSQRCPPVSAVPAGLPGAPGDLLAVGGTGSVQLTWSPPANDGGHPILGYLILRMEEGGILDLIAEAGPGSSEHIDGDVVNGVVYTYSVVAFTDVGDSDRSEMASAMPYGPPEGPLNLVAQWVDGQVHLSWSAPGNDGGSQVMGYLVHRHDRSDDNVSDVSHLVLSLADGEVDLGATYNYTVWAYNTAGTGSGTVVSITVPPPDPDPPRSSGDSQWALYVIALVLFVVAALLVIMRGRGGVPGQAIL
jgi:hypothetical protein